MIQLIYDKIKHSKATLADRVNKNISKMEEILTHFRLIFLVPLDVAGVKPRRKKSLLRFVY